MKVVEDVEISKRLRKYKIKLIKEKTITSPRRFERNGILRTILLMQKIRLLYFFKVSPKKLNKMFYT